MITVCGKSATLAEIEKVEFRRPDKAGRYWQGVPHKTLIETILGDCEERGWKVRDLKMSLNGTNSELVGAVSLDIQGISAPEGQELCLGWITSNAMKKRLRIVAGAKVFVCENGVVSGDLLCLKKHTINLSLKEEIHEGLNQYLNKVFTLKEQVEKMKQIKLNDSQVDKHLMDAGRMKIMPWSRIGEIDQQWRKPRFSDFSEKNAWSLYNAFTWTVKRNPPQSQMDQIQAFRELIMN